MTNRILLIYTGGTIGMAEDPKSGALTPLNFDQLSAQIPEIIKLSCDLSVWSFAPPIDSSDIRPSHWQALAHKIKDEYNRYDGFVILHGTDTMAYTASALSFMLENLSKPVIITGSQLPIGMLRTDGKENLVTAIEIAAAKNTDGQPMVKEVAIYFESRLMRGNRTRKYNSEHFDAFHSPNFPKLADAGISINYFREYLLSPVWAPLDISANLDSGIAILKIFPGLSAEFVNHFCSMPGLKALILEAFGAGNCSTDKMFLAPLRHFIDKGGLVINVTQCYGGGVLLGKYETSRALQEMGVISGADLTTEAALTKWMYLSGKYSQASEVRRQMQLNLRGEMTPVT